MENEIFEVKNDRVGRNEEIPLKRSRTVKHQVRTCSSCTAQGECAPSPKKVPLLKRLSCC